MSPTMTLKMALSVETKAPRGSRGANGGYMFKTHNVSNPFMGFFKIIPIKIADTFVKTFLVILSACMDVYFNPYIASRSF